MQDEQKKVKEVWEGYWEGTDLSSASLPRPVSYQLPVLSMLQRLIRENGFSSVMNAGCGQDPVSAYLKKEFGNALDVCLFDISEKVLDYNRRLFESEKLSVKTVQGDIFAMPFPDGSFDIVFNTGVMEHFPKEDQVSMIREVMRVIKPGGFYVTANPSDGGIIYKFGMATAKRKGIWPFGIEVPIKTFRFAVPEVESIASLHEIKRDFSGQLNFLSYVHPFWKYVTFPFRFAARVPVIHRIFDMTFGKIFGTYLLISVFRKK